MLVEENEKKRQFSLIYNNEVDTLFRYVALRVANKAETIDIVQDSFVRFWRVFNEGTTIINSRSFLFTIARNRIIDWYRKKKTLSLEAMTELQNGEFFEIKDESVEGVIEKGTDASLVLMAINKLTPQYREAVYLRFVEDLQPQDIAQILNITPNAVSIRINRGLEELRKILGIRIQ